MEICRLPGGPSGGFVCSRPAARRCHPAAACRIVPRASPTWSSGRHPPEDLPPACAPVSSLSWPDQFSAQLAFASSWDKSGVGSGRVPESMTFVHLCYLIVPQHNVINVHPRQPRAKWNQRECNLCLLTFTPSPPISMLIEGSSL